MHVYFQFLKQLFIIDIVISLLLLLSLFLKMAHTQNQSYLIL